MSGRTFTYTTGFDSFVKTLMPEVEAPVRRKAGGVGDGMLRDVEEFINRFCVTAANDDGDLTFDAAGTYTFDGNVVVNGDLTLGSSGIIKTAASGARSELAHVDNGGIYTSTGLLMQPGSADNLGYIVCSTAAGTHFMDIVPPWDTGGGGSIGTIQLDDNNNVLLSGAVVINGLQNGSASAPSMSFDTDGDTGMYRYGTNQIGFTAGGSVRFRVGTTAHISTEPFQTADGSVSACAYSFSSDTNTGMFRNSGSSFLGFVWNGSTGLAIRSTDVIPGSDNTKNLGDTSFRWVDVWAVDSTINTSDSRDKREVTDLDLGLDFVLQLRPVHYKWNDRGGYVGTRKHHGFVAQEVAAALGPEAANRGLWISAPGKPAEPGMPGGKPTPPREALRPAELIPVLTKAIQELAARVEALETP
jgi:hypothetical protein